MIIVLFLSDIIHGVKENLMTFLLVSLDYERLLETVYDGDYWRLQRLL